MPESRFCAALTGRKRAHPRTPNGGYVRATTMDRCDIK